METGKQTQLWFQGATSLVCSLTWSSLQARLADQQASPELGLQAVLGVELRSSLGGKHPPSCAVSRSQGLQSRSDLHCLPPCSVCDDSFTFYFMSGDCLCLCTTCILCPQRADRASDPLGLELQVCVSHPVWVLGIEPGSSRRTGMDLIKGRHLSSSYYYSFFVMHHWAENNRKSLPTPET